MDHLRNHVASALDEDLIAYTDVFAPDFVFVVQRGTTDRDASNAHGFELSRWCQRTGAPHADVDRQHSGDGLLRCKLKGNGPARMMGCRPQRSLPAKTIDLHHHPVSIVFQCVAMLLQCRQ